MYLASEQSVDIKVTARKNISSAVLGNEGLFNVNLVGEGTAVLESIIVEYGFIDNSEDIKRVEENYKKYVEAVIRAICEYKGIKYKLQEIDLKPGDILFLYTDGVVEATSLDKELYDALIKGLFRFMSNLSAIDIN